MSMMGPAPGIAAAAAAAIKLSPVDSILAAFNTNPYFIGLMMLMLNLGGRFLAMEVTKGQEAFFSHPFVRRGLIFVVLFIATRNIVTAFWLWLVIVASLGYLFNENSAYCILGQGGLQGSTCSKPKGPAPPKPTDQEVAIYRMLGEKVKVWEAFENMADSAAADEAAATAATEDGQDQTKTDGSKVTKDGSEVEIDGANVVGADQLKRVKKSSGGTDNSVIATTQSKNNSAFYMASLKRIAAQTTAPTF
jgi:hypothetical protein